MDNQEQEAKPWRLYPYYRGMIIGILITIAFYELGN